MNFKEVYTTDAKIKQEAENAEVKDKIEAKKTIISNDAYVMAEVFEQFNKSIHNLIRSLVK